MEERERLEEENERIEELAKGKGKKSSKEKKEKEKDGEKEEGEEDEERVLDEEEIDARCEALRKRLLKESEDDDEQLRGGGGGKGKIDRRHLKSYQVHELAEAKIEESERLRRALGIKEDRETGEISSSRERRVREERD